MYNLSNRNSIETQSAFYECTIQHTTLLNILCTGEWSLYKPGPSILQLESLLKNHPSVKSLNIEFKSTTNWDSSFILFVVKCQVLAATKNLTLNVEALPDTVKKWLQLYTENTTGEVLEIESKVTSHSSWIENITESINQNLNAFIQALKFIDTVGAQVRLVWKHPKLFRWKDCIFFMYQTGVQALPIVCLISFLVGMIMAFVGSLQLEQFGASIYIANLVGLVVVREMGAMMTGIILAGRTGAAFAASICSMKLNEEIDALSTLGINVHIFLGLPRILAVIVVTPLLCVVSNFVGILGGFIIGMSKLNLSYVQYVHQTQKAIGLTDFFVGTIKSIAFGFLIAVIGCFKGFKSGNTAESVGTAATSAVVWGITAIIIADACFAIIMNLFNV